jgi:hypothetical protein
MNELPATWLADNYGMGAPVDYEVNPRFDGPARHIVIGAMPTARAGQATPRAVLRRLGHAVPIAIAVFCVVWFGGQLIRAVLS